MPTDIKDRAVNYSQMVLYVILAFQEFYNEKYTPLKNKIDNQEILITNQQSQINNMQTIITAQVNRLSTV